MTSQMTIKSQVWSPDTCSCIIEMQYETGPEISLSDVTFSLKTIHRKCDYHSTLPDDDEVWTVVTEENPRKNRSIAKIIENAPEEWVELLDEKTGEKKLKEGIAVDYDFIVEQDKTKRTLELSVIGVESSSLDPSKKEDIQSSLDTEFSDKEKDGDVVFKEAKPTRDDIDTDDDVKDPKTEK